MNSLHNYANSSLAGDDSKVGRLLRQAHTDVQGVHASIDAIALYNQRKVLDAFHKHRVSSQDLVGSTGYGLDDEGRDKLERVYAAVFGTEAALVRAQIVSGTHALRLALFGVLRPGQNVVFATGSPYDTLEAVVGIRETPGSLAEWGVSHDIVPLDDHGCIDIERVLRSLRPATKVVFFQRSRGYTDRRALTVDEIGNACQAVHAQRPDIVLMVDNCYGEFTEKFEPTEVGADLVVGSLIKNPGGGIASTGGYLAGRAVCVEQAAAQLTAPGVGAEVGPSHDFLRPFYQGLFLAPHMVAQALKGSVLAAKVFSDLGLAVSPGWDEVRSDLILTTRFDSVEALLKFCRAVQASAPIDAHVMPYGAPMAGYSDEVVMAAGTFVQGGSLEMSADAPLRPPFIGYFQGGLTYEHVYLALEDILSRMLSDN